MPRIGNPRKSLTEEIRIEWNVRIGLRCRSIREEHNRQYPDDNVTQEGLAHSIGVIVVTISQLERGKYGTQLSTLVKIATYWGMSVQDMLGGIEGPTIEDIFNAPRIKKILGEA